MPRSATLQTIVVLMLGAALGYLAASSDAHPFRKARAASVSQPGNSDVGLGDAASPVTCSGSTGKATLLAARMSGGLVRPGHAQPSAKRPNILVIFGDDIGIPQISA
jgi:hypothetical protein